MTGHEGNLIRCVRCGDVIGVYEPLIVLRDGEAVETSRAADRTVAGEPGERFHRYCYTEHGEGPK